MLTRSYVLKKRENLDNRRKNLLMFKQIYYFDYVALIQLLFFSVICIVCLYNLLFILLTERSSQLLKRI